MARADQQTDRMTLGPPSGDTDFVLTLAALVEVGGATAYGPSESDKKVLRTIRERSTSPRLILLIDRLLHVEGKPGFVFEFDGDDPVLEAWYKRFPDEWNDRFGS
jgi:hypothetical protein